MLTAAWSLEPPQRERCFFPWLADEWTAYLRKPLPPFGGLLGFADVGERAVFAFDVHAVSDQKRIALEVEGYVIAIELHFAPRALVHGHGIFQ